MSFSLTEEGRKIVEDYILFMLGAPVVKIELDPQQIKFAIDSSLDYLRTWVVDKVNDREGRMVRNLINQGALIHAKFMLGRIRSKYDSINTGSGDVTMDGKALLAEAGNEIGPWRESVKYFAQYGLGRKEDNVSSKTTA